MPRINEEKRIEIQRMLMEDRESPYSVIAKRAAVSSGSVLRIAHKLVAIGELDLNDILKRKASRGPTGPRASTEQRNKDILRLMRRPFGLTAKEVAQELGIQRNVVTRALHDQGIETVIDTVIPGQRDFPGKQVLLDGTEWGTDTRPGDATEYIDEGREMDALVREELASEDEA